MLIKSSRTLLFVCIALTLYYLIYFYRIGQPDLMYFDENYFVKTARHIVNDLGYPERTHPPLGKLLIAGSIAIFGDVSWAWRLPALLFSGGSLILIGLAVFTVTKSKLTAWLSPIILIFDGLWMTHSRIGILNAPALFFSFAFLYSFLQYYETRRWPFEKSWIISATFLGIAVAIRWDSIIMLAFAFLWTGLKNQKLFLVHPNDRPNEKGKWPTLLFAAILFLVLYCIPFLILINQSSQLGISSFYDLQKSILYHLKDAGRHQYTSPWWSWIFLMRPIWFGLQANFTLENVGDQLAHGIICIGNPVLFWAAPIAIAALFCLWLQKKDTPFLFIFCGLVIFWLPIGLLDRATHFNHFYPTLPFIGTAIAFILNKLWNWNTAGKVATVTYMGYLIGMALYWYPLWTGMHVPYTFIEHHIWFQNWWS